MDGTLLTSKTDHDSVTSSSPSPTNPSIDTQPPTTPRHQQNVPGELSPPGSQDVPHSHQNQQYTQLDDNSIDMFEAADEVDNEVDDAELYDPETGATGLMPGAGSRRGTIDGGSGAATAGKGSGKYVPGSGWNNKKAQDEYHRALENVVDQDFSLVEFGDVLLDEGGRANGNGLLQAQQN